MALMPELDTDNYYGAFHFRVSIPDVAGDVNQAFVKVSGVVSQSEKMEFMHGTDPYMRKSVGRTQYEDVTLERIYNGSDAFYAWRMEVEQGLITRKDVTVYMLKQDGSTVRTMVCRKAWPVRWELPEMDAQASGPAVERITLAVEAVTNS
jgi:phage tail-like protein